MNANTAPNASDFSANNPSASASDALPPPPALTGVSSLESIHHLDDDENTSTSIDLQLEIYRTAFALNNMGVRLIEMGYYRHAAKTLHDAVATLQQQQTPSSYTDADADADTNSGGVGNIHYIGRCNAINNIPSRRLSCKQQNGVNSTSTNRQQDGTLAAVMAATGAPKDTVASLQHKLRKASMRVARREQDQLEGNAAAAAASVQRRRKRPRRRRQQQQKQQPYYQSWMVQVSTIDDCEFQEMARAAQQYGPSTSLLFPIRFRTLVTHKNSTLSSRRDNGDQTNRSSSEGEDIGDDSDSNTQVASSASSSMSAPSIDWQIAALLYNYAMARWLCYRCCPNAAVDNDNTEQRTNVGSSSSVKNHLAEAGRLLRFTATVLLSKTCEASAAVDSSSAALSTDGMSHILLKSLVLSLLSTVCLFQNKTARVHKLQQSLARLERRAVKLEEEAFALDCLVNQQSDYYAAKAA